jgi:hypothetical protein
MTRMRDYPSILCRLRRRYKRLCRSILVRLIPREGEPKMATAEAAGRDYEAIMDAYAAEKATDPYLARQRRVWIMLAEKGRMRVSEGTLEGRSDRLDQRF